MPEESDPGHEAYSREHALWHVWKAARYYAAFEAMEEMLKIERKQHENPNRTARMSVLEFSKKALDHLIEQELVSAHTELTTYLTRAGKLSEGDQHVQEQAEEKEQAAPQDVLVPTATLPER